MNLNGSFRLRSAAAGVGSIGKAPGGQRQRTGARQGGAGLIEGYTGTGEVDRAVIDNLRAVNPKVGGPESVLFTPTCRFRTAPPQLK